ncbi:hypothetical protein ACFPFV_12705 [Salinicoccus siamensis]|uniref:hypothetical protein n=1 Tax=Salinicoccus siamensis TaxID=381830 RepID=UPI00361A2465
MTAGNPKNIKSYADIADITRCEGRFDGLGTTQFDFLDQEGVDPSQIMSVGDIPGQLSAVQSATPMSRQRLKRL